MVIWYGLKIIYFKIVQLLTYIFYALKVFILYIKYKVRSEEFSNHFSKNRINRYLYINVRILFLSPYG